MNINSKKCVQRNFLQDIVGTYKIIVVDLVGFNDHKLPFFSAHSHTCIREEVLEDSNLLTKVTRIHFHKKNINGKKKKDDYYIIKSWSNTTSDFQTVF
jgi:hypothetical protein